MESQTVSAMRLANKKKNVRDGELSHTEILAITRSVDLSMANMCERVTSRYADAAPATSIYWERSSYFSLPLFLPKVIVNDLEETAAAALGEEQ